MKRIASLGSAFVVAACVVSGCGTRVSLGELELDDASTTEPLDAMPTPETGAPAKPKDDGGADAADARPVFDAAPDGGYVPCAGKSCGDECKLCDPKQVGCVETAVLKACDATGQCVSEVPSC